MTAEAKIDVGFIQIDKMGIVHNSVYPLWFETGRNKLLKSAGLPDSRINSYGLFLPLVEIQCRYRSPARFGDKLVVQTELSEVTFVKVKFEYRVLERKSGRLIATGRSAHVWTDGGLMPQNIERVAPDVYGRLKEFSSTSGIVGGNEV